MNKLRQNYNDVLADIYESNLLGAIFSAITGNKEVHFPKLSEGVGDLIRRANYSLS